MNLDRVTECCLVLIFQSVKWSCNAHLRSCYAVSMGKCELYVVRRRSRIRGISLAIFLEHLFEVVDRNEQDHGLSNIGLLWSHMRTFLKTTELPNQNLWSVAKKPVFFRKLSGNSDDAQLNFRSVNYMNSCSFVLLVSLLTTVCLSLSHLMDTGPVCSLSYMNKVSRNITSLVDVFSFILHKFLCVALLAIG